MFLILSSLVVACIFRRRRSTCGGNHDEAAFEPTAPGISIEDQRGISDNARAELQDGNPLEELPDNGKAELRDRITRRSLEFRLQELPSLENPWVSELMTSERATRSANARLTKTTSNFAFTPLAELGKGSKARGIEDAISHHRSRAASIVSSSQRAANLNRSLPPTPISESPQASRAISVAEAAMIEDILRYYYCPRTSYHSKRASSHSEATSCHFERA